MKKIACIVAGLFVALTMAAQTKVTWSMELGLGMSTWMGKDAGDSSPLFNQKVGASKGASIDVDYVGANTKNVVDMHVNQNYFEMPLLAAFHVGTAANFDMVFTAGPYLAYGVNGKRNIDIDDLTVSYNTFGESKIEGEIVSGLRRFDAGVMAGVALDFKRWTVGLDGEFGCCKLASNSKTRNLAFFFTAGYKF